jgi:hypothetical protein
MLFYQFIQDRVMVVFDSRFEGTDDEPPTFELLLNRGSSYEDVSHLLANMRPPIGTVL